MYIILSQKIDSEPIYSDVLFKMYHYPAKYKNQLKPGDVFIYYQGNQHKKEQRYYFGTGKIGNIFTPDGDNYYAELTKCYKFMIKVPIYLTDGGYIEQMDYVSVRKKLNPPWQNSIRPLSKEAYDYIISHAGELIPLNKEEELNSLKTELKRAVKSFYIGRNNNAVLEIIETSQKIAANIHLVSMVADGKPERYQDPLISKKTVEDETVKKQFFDYCRTMKMSYSYKPVLILALLEKENGSGEISVQDASVYFKNFYQKRRELGIIIEKGNCIYQKPDMNYNDIARNIVANPVKALLSSGHFQFNKESQMFGVIPNVWNRLDEDDIKTISSICHQKLEQYYSVK